MGAKSPRKDEYQAPRIDPLEQYHRRKLRWQPSKIMINSSKNNSGGCAPAAPAAARAGPHGFVKMHLSRIEKT